jgi:hypothetical protein
MPLAHCSHLSRERSMKQFLLVLALFAAAPSFAQDQPASEKSIREFMAVSKTKDMLDGMWAQIDSSMDTAVESIMQGKPLSAEQQKAVVNMRAKLAAIFKEEMGWDILEPVFVDVYKKSFTQKELDGILVFYKSAAGKAMVAKLPVVIKNSNDAMMSRVQAMVPRMQELQRELGAELQKAEGK